MYQSCDPKGISPVLASCFIALNKCPGVTPIGIGEIHRRIIANVDHLITWSNLQDAAGPRQSCAWQIANSEAATHGMRSLLSRKDNDAVLLVDARDVFNSVNRKMELRNIHLCPPLANILINTYGETH